MKPKLGIIQSRGLGDIVIALPIADYYVQQGYSVFWPICQEFVSHFETVAPQITWIPVVTDAVGHFFYDQPRLLLDQAGVEEHNILYLYQYLSSRPDLTDPELFNILKFDQYKYWVAEVPFAHKWRLGSCITRNLDREQALSASLNLAEPYSVVHLSGSNFRANVDLSWLSGTVVDIDQHHTSCLFDWIGVLSGAESVVMVDSVFANLVDSLMMSIPNKYWIRRSPWDLTPVLGGSWTVVPTSLPIVETRRVDVTAAARGLGSQNPTVAKPGWPTSYMSAIKQQR